MPPHPFDRLWSELRREAEQLRRFGARGEADAVEHCVQRLEDAWLEWQSQELTVAEAAAESGYSAAHLRRLLAENRIESAGSKGRPRIRRADLPRKPSRQPSDEIDLVGEVLRAREANGL